MPIIIPSASWKQSKAIIKVMNVHIVVPFVLRASAARDISTVVIIHRKQSIAIFIVVVAVTFTMLKKHGSCTGVAVNVVEWNGIIGIHQLAKNLLCIDKDL